MDNIVRALREYVNSGEYFTEARKWYHDKYITPLCFRSMAMCFVVFALLMLSILGSNIHYLLPLVKYLEYSITIDGGKAENGARIIKADSISNNPLQSISKILLEDYVKIRERYSYGNLEEQFRYVKATSSRLVFKRFDNYLSIDNQDSPVLRYQRDGHRIIVVNDVKFIDSNTAEVTFDSETKDASNQIFESMSWIATIDFESDQIKLGQPSDTPFNFVVTDYKLKLIKDKINAAK